MKYCILMMIIWAAGIKTTQAQITNQALKSDSSATHPYKNEPAPLYIINSHNKQYALDSLYSCKDIDPNWIQTVSVLVDKSAASIYGKRAAHGVVIVTIKEEEYPAAFKTLKKHMKKIKTKTKLPQQL
jgi:TonB-dependent SusC/RagA subfamily outer membrane receptor